MSQFKDKLIELHAKYKEFDTLVQAKNEELKGKEGIFKNTVTSLDNDEEVEKFKNLYIDSMILNSQLRMHFENLMFFIASYYEIGEDDLPQDIKDFYNTSLRFKAKTIFAIEKGDFTPTDEELLAEARRQVLDSPLMKMLTPN